MNDNEKNTWLIAFLIPAFGFMLGWFGYEFNWETGNSIVGWWSVILTVITLVSWIFRLTYLAGRKSR